MMFMLLVLIVTGATYSSSQPSLTRSYTRTFVCPNETVTFVCSEISSNNLQWVAEPVVLDTQSERVLFTSTGSSSSVPRDNIVMSRRSVEPLTIDMIIMPSENFVNNSIVCIGVNGETNTSDYIVRLPGTVESPTNPSFIKQGDSSVEVQWEPSTTSEIERYILRCDPECGVISVGADQTSTRLSLEFGNTIVSIHAVDVCGLESDTVSLLVELPQPPPSTESNRASSSTTPGGVIAGITVAAVVIVILVVVAVIGIACFTVKRIKRKAREEVAEAEEKVAEAQEEIDEERKKRVAAEEEITKLKSELEKLKERKEKLRERIQPRIQADSALDDDKREKRLNKKELKKVEKQIEQVEKKIKAAEEREPKNSKEKSNRSHSLF